VSDEQNIEIDRTALKADLVYNIQYRGNPRILNLVGFRTILRRSKAISLLSCNF